MFDIKEYYEAGSANEVKELLAANPAARIIAGGTDVLIKLREGKFSDIVLIGIGRIAELNEVNIDDMGMISIGPTATFAQLEKDPVISENLPYLGEAGGTMGGPQVRNLATIGGNVCNGAPSADSSTTLFCLNALLRLESSQGIREVEIGEFYQGPGKVDLKPDELLTRILIRPKDYKGFSGKYIKSSQRRAMDIATLGCAVSVKTTEGLFADLRIAFGVAAPTPVRCPKTEVLAVGMDLSEQSIEKIGDMTLSDVTPRDSWRGSKAYRQQLIKVNAKRAIREAILRSGGEIHG